MSATRSLRAARAQAWRESVGGAAAVAVATAVFAMTVSGLFTNYVQPWFRWMLLASSAVIALLGLWSLMTAADTLDEAREHAARSSLRASALDGDDHPHGGSDHHHGTPRVAALLLVPALLFAVAAPNSLGAAAAANDTRPRPRRANATPVDFKELPANKITDLTVQDYSDRFMWGDPAKLEGKRVRMIGFVAQPVGKAYWTVNRFRIYCCAADANLFSVGVKDASMPPGKDVWVEVVGTIATDASRDVPVLVTDEVNVIPQPAEPYL